VRLITWNCCRGSFDKKVSLLQEFNPDIAVVQECGRPANEAPSCLWFGDNPRQGITLFANNGYRFNPLPQVPEVPPYTIPLQVSGPQEFLLLAVWSKRHPTHPYIEGVVRAVEEYRDLITSQPTVLLGDLNSNAIWDHHHPSSYNHSALVQILAELGLVSSYHTFFGEEHGVETFPTYYLWWKQDRPFHIDYCFIPQTWAPQLKQVNVGGYDEWSRWSDHRPLVVDIDVEKNGL
jgi:exonuclease III